MRSGGIGGLPKDFPVIICFLYIFFNPIRCAICNFEIGVNHRPTHLSYFVGAAITIWRQIAGNIIRKVEKYEKPPQNGNLKKGRKHTQTTTTKVNFKLPDKQDKKKQTQVKRTQNTVRDCKRKHM